MSDEETRMAITEEQRRTVALCRFECPDCGAPLEEWEEVDELGPRVYYRCSVGGQVFGSVYDGVGGYAPADNR